MTFRFGSKMKLFGDLLRRDKPLAQAVLKGGEEASGLYGKVNFYPAFEGVLICAEIFDLPKGEGNCPGKTFGFHIHEGKSCSGTKDDPFSSAGMHYNLGNCPHPAHAGDMPPLMTDGGGYAWMAFYTKRITMSEVIGRTVVIHSNPDDFHSQPSGNSGKKIACGVIKQM